MIVMVSKIEKIKNNLMFKIVSKVLKTVGVLLLILFLCLILIQKFSDNKMTLGGYSVFTVISGSMEPNYHVWDMLIAKKVDTSTIKVGDDVVYLGSEDTFKDKIVTHRVIKVRNDSNGLYFTTKGTANAIEDPEIAASQVYGKVVYRSVVLCFLSKILNSVYGFYLVVFVPFVIILFLEILSVMKAKERKRRRRELELKKSSADDNQSNSSVSNDNHLKLDTNSFDDPRVEDNSQSDTSSVDESIGDKKDDIM